MIRDHPPNETSTVIGEVARLGTSPTRDGLSFQYCCDYEHISSRGCPVVPAVIGLIMEPSDAMPRNAMPGLKATMIFRHHIQRDIHSGRGSNGTAFSMLFVRYEAPSAITEALTKLEAEGIVLVIRIVGASDRTIGSATSQKESAYPSAMQMSQNEETKCGEQTS
ncbi:hypothetical protein M422DRAFT_39239 [Sphaerobolus stellatus SS14]|uniref:Unplaced genomic scaffold SPHSTscaffold_435, whole genome shotgun sequence n=1 Tax=Sphaerobolus stellatus (strain SS14) TaxID=990650 RepID=A0A0C9UGB9_SPHS4|nr:hypothetical protein M422DRAFT_39239 [Sphaerobolus stellatus SS14]